MTRAGNGAQARTARRHVGAATALLAALTLIAGCGHEGAASIGSFVEDTAPSGSSGTLVAARGDTVLACEGWGLADRERDVASGCDTVYDVMSMTKQFTAAAVMKLQMQGALDVTDPIGRHLGPVPPDMRDITVHHLLTHTSGLVETLGADDDAVSSEDVVAGAFASTLTAPPGQEYRYSNLGYSLLAAVIEEVSGTGYEEYLAEHLFTPAGMTQTGYVLPEWDDAEVAVLYDADGRAHGRPFDQPWAADGPYWNLRGNGGMLSTARDMVRWHAALAGEEILDAEAKAALFEPHVREEPNGDTFYGYGWVLQDADHGPEAWHNGGSDWGYGEIARVLDADVLVFWVGNQNRSAPDGWDLSEIGPDLTAGVIQRVVDDDASS